MEIEESQQQYAERIGRLFLLASDAGKPFVFTNTGVPRVTRKKDKRSSVFNNEFCALPLKSRLILSVYT